MQPPAIATAGGCVVSCKKMHGPPKNACAIKTIFLFLKTLFNFLFFYLFLQAEILFYPSN
jgi:hypothetical protein